MRGVQYYVTFTFLIPTYTVYKPYVTMLTHIGGCVQMREPRALFSYNLLIYLNKAYTATKCYCNYVQLVAVFTVITAQIDQAAL